LWPARRNVALSVIGNKAVAFCGIARPQQFFKGIKELGQEAGAEIAFPDHHRYREPDVERLLRLKSKTGAAGFVTTEKDLVNLGALAERLQPLGTSELHIELEAPEQALNLLFESLVERSGCRL